MSNYKDIDCKKYYSKFYSAVNAKPFAALLILGNLYFLLNKNISISQKRNTKAIINTIKNTISARQVNLVFNTAFSIDDAHKGAMEKDIVQVVENCAWRFFTEKDLREKLDTNNLILAAREERFCLAATICLIQNHLKEMNESDPFARFDYCQLELASHSQLSQYVARLVKDCKSLPSENMVKIGKSSEPIALILIKILYEHNSRYDIEAKLVDLYPSIRAKVAKKWTNTVSSIPLTTVKEKNFKQKSKELSQKYPEFEKVVTVRRANSGAQTQLATTELQNHVPPLSLFGAFMGIVLKPAAFPVVKSCIVAGTTAGLAPALLPVAGFAALGACLGLYSNMSNEESKNSSPKP